MVAPIITATLQSAALAATSNLTAQFIQIYRSNKTYSIDLIPILHFILLRFFNGPPYFLWQQYLEEAFPGTYETAIPSEGRNSKDSDPAAKNAPEKHRHWGNTLKKFLLDQSFGNIAQSFMFIAVMAGLRGASGQQVMMAVSQGTWPMTMARLKFWPIAGLAAFTVIPPERRVLFNSFVGMIWGIYLSLVA